MRKLPIALAAAAASAGLFGIGAGTASAAPADNEPCGTISVAVCVFASTGYRGAVDGYGVAPDPGQCFNNGAYFRSVYNNSAKTITIRPSGNCTGGPSFDIAPFSGTDLGWNGLSIGGYP